MPTWPGTLPQDPEIDGLVEQPPDTILRTQMDAGPAKVRRRFTAGVRPFRMKMLLTKTQVADLETFFVTTLKYGSESFDWHNPRTQASEEFRFVGPPAYNMLGPDTWMASFTVEQLP